MKKSLFLFLACLVVSSLFAQQPARIKQITPDNGAFSAKSTEMLHAMKTVTDTVPRTDSLVFDVVVPQGTHDCWIAGTFNNWNTTVHQLDKVDDTHYSITLYNVGDPELLEYKYLSGPGNWDFVEIGLDKMDIDNRYYAPNDTVLLWKQVYVPPVGGHNPKNITFRVTVPFNVQTVQVAGSFNNWMPYDQRGLMNNVGTNSLGKVFEKTIFIEYPENLEYKFCAGPEWGFVQVQPDNFNVPDPVPDTLRHVVLAFFSYFNSGVQPMNWLFSLDPFNGLPHFKETTDMMGLRILGSPDIPMNVDINEKINNQFRFTHRLRTNGPGRCDAAAPAKPVANAIAFKVGESAQVHFNALPAGTDSAELLITNGVDTLAWGLIPPEDATNPNWVPGWVFHYEGVPTTIYMYTTNIGIDYYLLGATDYRGLPYDGPEVTYTVVVPRHTQQVYIAGDFSNWQPHWMDRKDEHTFTATIQGATTETQYKYLSGPNWDFSEMNADGSERANRTWTPLDTVVAWRNIYSEEYTKVYTENLNVMPGEEFFITVKSSSNLPKEAIAYQFDFFYNQNVLEYMGYEAAGTVAQSGTVVVNSLPDQGTLHISFMSENPFPWTADLIKLKFRVINTTNDNITYVWLGDVYLNDEPVYTVETGDIHINWFKYGDVDGNTMVQAYDAALTLQYSVGKDPLPHLEHRPWTSWRAMAADVDGVNGITANDAALILQYSAWMINHFPVDPDSTQNQEKMKGMVYPELSFEQEGNRLVVRSHGNVIGVNLFLKDYSDALAAPEISPQVSMSAVNISNGIYAIGLVTLQPLPDGSVLLSIPLNDAEEVEYAFTAYVNEYQKEYSNKIYTGLNQAKTAKLHFYPNPVRNVMTLSQLTDGAEISISDISGRTVYYGKAAGSMVELQLNELANGMYTLMVVTNGVREVSKFIKE